MGNTVAGREDTAGPIAQIRGFLAGGTTGAALACMVCAVIIKSVPVFVTGAGLLVLTVVVLLVLERRREAGKGTPATRTALALIEDLRATGGETADVPVRFDLTVAPDDRTAYRVTVDQPINLVDIPTYRPRGMTVVEYRPDAPWEVEIVTRPSPEWLRRAETAKVDSAPEFTREKDRRKKAGSSCFIGLVGLLLGAVAVILLLRGELFDDSETRPGSSPSSSSSSSHSSSSSSSTSTFSSSTTVSGPSASMLDIGRMRDTAESLADRVGTPSVAELGIEEHRMAVSGETGGPKNGARSIDLRTLPYELFPGLVREARNTLGVRDPEAWRIDVEPASGGRDLTVRVSVTGEAGKAFLEADAQGRITGRHPRN
ncbi:hypothetical protein PUR28_08405 [Streptomyces sp. BE308]|uniref:hypothetical protein n=1 Tax=Streptomyces sp. BE308 TaxID=3002529 RepID=UPI002E773D12|nr:hypothetical protein [Streptomyces sp. BE308]MEE1790796.1 hypothetical protein [Streptomyces sp. BE308]